MCFVPSGLVEVKIEDSLKNCTIIKFDPSGDYSTLEKLHILNQRLENDAIYELINHLKGIPSLTILNLGWNKFSGAFDVGKLSSLKTLQRFWINSNQITDVVNTFNGTISSIEFLDFWGNKLRFEDLNKYRNFVNLKWLWLNENELVKIVGYANAKVILPNIKRISIEVNEFMCPELESMVTPYKGTNFWYYQKETSCDGRKSVLYDDVACCYPF